MSSGKREDTAGMWISVSTEAWVTTPSMPLDLRQKIERNYLKLNEMGE